MPTLEIKTIKPAGGGDYTTINAWDAAERANLVTGDKIKRAEVYGGGNACSTWPVINTGWTTSATCYVEIAAAPGMGHAGVRDTITKAYFDTTSWKAQFYKHVYLTRMQVKGPGAIYFPDKDGFVDQCLVEHPWVSGGNSIPAIHNEGAGTTTVRNSEINAIESANSVGVQQSGTGAVIVENSNIIVQAYALYRAAAGTLTSQNNYLAVLAGGNCYAGTVTKGDHDATVNAEAPTASLRNIAYSTLNFINVTSGSENHHLTPASALRGMGIALGDITTDFEDDVRPNPPSIGVDDDAPATAAATTASRKKKFFRRIWRYMRNV